MTVFICLFMAFLANEYAETLTLTDAFDASESELTDVQQDRDIGNFEKHGIFTFFLDDTQTGQRLQESVNSPTQGVLASVAHMSAGPVRAFSNIGNTILGFFSSGLESADYLLAAGGALLYGAYAFLFQNILIVGERRWFLENRIYAKVPFSRIFLIYRERATRRVATVMFFRDLKLALWALTIVMLPVKYLEYMVIPYLLAENPEIETKDAFKLAHDMMHGHKRELLVLYLSLWYWELLSILTVGALRVFFLNGYLRTVEAEYYVTVREAALENDLEHSEQLQDFDLYTLPGELYEGGYPGTVRRALQVPVHIEYDRSYSMVNLVLMFFIFSFMGWCWEVGLHLMQTGTLVNRGIMHGPWLPIYGVGGLMILVLLRRFRDSPPRLFGMTMILCGVLEYATSYVLELMLGMRWWDYSGYLLNINGRICLEGLLAFAIGGVLFVYILAPIADEALNRVPMKIRTGLITVLATLFGLDLAYSILSPNGGEGITEG